MAGVTVQFIKEIMANSQVDITGLIPHFWEGAHQQNFKATLPLFAQCCNPDKPLVYASLSGIKCTFEWHKLKAGLFKKGDRILLYEEFPEKCKIREEGDEDLRYAFKEVAAEQGVLVDIYECNISQLPTHLKQQGLDTPDHNYFLSLDTYRVVSLMPLVKVWPLHKFGNRTSAEVSVTQRGKYGPISTAMNTLCEIIQSPVCLGQTQIPVRIGSGQRLIITLAPTIK